jgi:hypothetical protein
MNHIRTNIPTCFTHYIFDLTQYICESNIPSTPWKFQLPFRMTHSHQCRLTQQYHHEQKGLFELSKGTTGCCNNVGVHLLDEVVGLNGQSVGLALECSSTIKKMEPNKNSPSKRKTSLVHQEQARQQTEAVAHSEITLSSKNLLGKRSYAAMTGS